MTYEAGQHKAQCDRCGFWRKSGALRREWTGLMVCSDTCWEARNVQENVRGIADKQAPPWVRPPSDGPDVTVETGTPVTPEDL